jgi:hypothetical protein
MIKEDKQRLGGGEEKGDDRIGHQGHGGRERKERNHKRHHHHHPGKSHRHKKHRHSSSTDSDERLKKHRNHVEEGNRKHNQSPDLKELERTLEEMSKELCYGHREDDDANMTYATPSLGMRVIEDENMNARGNGENSFGGEVPNPSNNAKDVHAVDVEAPPEKLRVASEVAPPPELLERMHKLVDAQAHVPKAIPLDMHEEYRKL